MSVFFSFFANVELSCQINRFNARKLFIRLRNCVVVRVWQSFSVRPRPCHIPVDRVTPFAISIPIFSPLFSKLRAPSGARQSDSFYPCPCRIAPRLPRRIRSSQFRLFSFIYYALIEIASPIRSVAIRFILSMAVPYYPRLPRRIRSSQFRFFRYRKAKAPLVFFKRGFWFSRHYALAILNVTVPSPTSSVSPDNPAVSSNAVAKTCSET